MRLTYIYFLPRKFLFLGGEGGGKLNSNFQKFSLFSVFNECFSWNFRHETLFLYLSSFDKTKAIWIRMSPKESRPFQGIKLGCEMVQCLFQSGGDHFNKGNRRNRFAMQITNRSLHPCYPLLLPIPTLPWVCHTHVVPLCISLWKIDTTTFLPSPYTPPTPPYQLSS